MKLIIGGSTGFVSEQIIGLALESPAVTSIVGLARCETTKILEGAGHPAGKFKSLVVENFESYSDEVKSHLSNADAAIWTIAVTPMRLKEIGWDETVNVCHDYAHYGLQTIAAAPRNQASPLRFIYISGHFAARPGDNGRPITALEDHGLTGMAHLWGAVEAYMLDFAKQSDGKIEACIAKPGFMSAVGRTPPPVAGLPSVFLEDVSATLVDQALNGIEKDTLSNDDLIRIGQRAQGK